MAAKKVDTHKARQMCDKDEWLAFQILMGNTPPTVKYSRDWAEETVYRVGKSKAVLEAVSVLWELDHQDVEQMLEAVPFLKLFMKPPTQKVEADLNHTGSFVVEVVKEFPTTKPEGDREN